MQRLEPSAYTGDVTFLFSDIEGSTARWKMYPDAMGVSLHRHDTLLHSVIADHGGHVFKTVGDAFCAAFDDPLDAIHSAIEAQRALGALDWTDVGGLRVRMAVHCGAVSQRDGDFFGSTVNRVARLLSAGHGGQIIVSADIAGIVGSRRAGDVELRDLGRHRLKDFPELESIYQVVAPLLPEIFPPLRTVAERPSNLPAHLQDLVGREDDLEQLIARLRDHRCASLIGAGGVGKTLLALHCGTQLLSEFDDGVWLAELAPVDAGAVASTLANVFGVSELGSGTVLDALIAYLRTRKLLLIVDNCEHVTGAAAQAIEKILRECAGVRVLATSRERLGLTAESVYRLPVLRMDAACRLFAERAHAHCPGFALTDENGATVERICRQLDGIALAIELAAARMRVLSVDQLAARLAERFRLLTGGKRDALPHHQTLRALIDWSYGLLSENERALLRRSALFPGGWTLGGALEVCADAVLEEWDILDHIGSLVDKSLVVVEETPTEPRYRMLESTREFALEQLEASGERDAIARKHVDFFARLAQRADDAWGEVPATAWMAPLNAELDNIRAALSWCVLDHTRLPLAMDLFTALEAYWWDGQPIEARRWLEALRPFPQAHATLPQTARYWLTAAGVALSLAREKQAMAAADSALAAYEALGDRIGVAAARRARGTALVRSGRADEGEACIREALAVFRESGNRRLTALALRSLAVVPALRGDIESAATLSREALTLSQSVQDERGVQIIAGNLAEFEGYASRFDEALAHAREALEIARSRRDWVAACTLLINTTAYLFALERLDEARSTAREALSIAGEIQSDLHLAVAIQHLGAIGAFCGDATRAAHLVGFADAAYARLELSREPTEAREYEKTMVVLGERLAAPNLIEALRSGSLLSSEQVKSEAILI